MVTVSFINDANSSIYVQLNNSIAGNLETHPAFFFMITTFLLGERK